MFLTRWERAEKVLLASLQPGARVLDLGCAYGFGTRLLAQHYNVTGIDASEEYIEKGRQKYPQIEFILADAEELPCADASFDAVVMLDVLEHVVDETVVLNEVRRVLKPGGWLLISVPNRGLLCRFDSLNVYEHFRRLLPGAPPLAEIKSTGIHRHYDVSTLRKLIRSDFKVRRIMRTGIGLPEFINIVLLITLRGILKWEAAYQIIQYAYFIAFMVEDSDCVRLGRHSYHLMLLAQKHANFDKR